MNEQNLMCNVSRIGHIIYFTDYVTETSCHELITLIKQIELEDDEVDNQIEDNNNNSLYSFENLPDNEFKDSLIKSYKDYFSLLEMESNQREPIQIHISSNGGDADTLMGVIETFRLCKNPIHTYCLSKAYSAGFTMFTCGDVRYLGEDASVMYHQISTECSGKIQDVIEKATEDMKFQKKIEEIVATNTSIPLEKLEEIREKKKDWYINPKEALELGVCDEVI